MIETISVEEIARDVIEQYVHRLGRSLAHIINILDPDAIVLGGGLSNISYIYQALQKHIEPYVFSDTCNTPIIQNQHGDSSGVQKSNMP